MRKLPKILLIILPLVLVIDFFTLGNKSLVRSTTLQNAGVVIGFISIFLLIALIIYFIAKGIAGLFRNKAAIEKNKEGESKEKILSPASEAGSRMTGSAAPVVKKESNRLFNLIWPVLFGTFIGPTLYYTQYAMLSMLYLAIALLTCLLLILPRRNNFFTLPFFLIIAAVTNTMSPIIAGVTNSISVTFYDLTGLFYPNLHAVASADGIAYKWLTIGGWGVAFVTVAAFVYVFLSALAKLIFKKTWAWLCFLIALFLTGLTAYILFFLLPITFTFPKTELSQRLEPSVKIEFLKGPDPTVAQHITSAQSTSPFFVYATGLQKGKRYGVRILNAEQKPHKEDGIFLYCRSSGCQLTFEALNHLSDRFEPGIYTIQLIAQEGNEMTIAAVGQMEITELVIVPYDKNADYPCTLWLTRGGSSEKLTRINADSQDMTGIQVYVQCEVGQTYDAYVSIGTIYKDTQYYQSTIDSTGEPVRIISLGGNVSHGLVRLIVDNQIMGEAIISRGFPICDGEKALEGGMDSDCKKNNAD